MTLRFCRAPILKVWECVEDPLTAMLEVEGIQILKEADTCTAVPLNPKWHEDNYSRMKSWNYINVHQYIH